MSVTLSKQPVSPVLDKLLILSGQTLNFAPDFVTFLEFAPPLNVTSVYNTPPQKKSEEPVLLVQWQVV